MKIGPLTLVVISDLNSLYVYYITHIQVIPNTLLSGIKYVYKKKKTRLFTDEFVCFPRKISLTQSANSAFNAQIVAGDPRLISKL